MLSTLTSVLAWCVWQYLLILLVLLSLIGLLSWASLIRHGPIAKLNYVIKFSLSFFCCLVGIYFTLPYILIRPRNLYSARIVSWFVKITTKITGVTYEVRSSKILEEDRGAILVLNHQSLLDGLVYTHLVPILKVATGIMKKELLYIFPIGQITWLGGGVFVDRSSPKAYRTLKNCVEKIHKDKMKALIFPEGTRNPVRGFLPFKKGAFKTAILGQLPIIPVVISPYYFINHEKREFKPGHVILQAMEPICTKGMVETDCDALTERTRNVMMAEYERLCAEVDQMSMKKEWRDKKRPQVFADGKGL